MGVSGDDLRPLFSVNIRCDIHGIPSLDVVLI